MALDPATWVLKAYGRVVEPWHTLSVRRSRLALFGRSPDGALPVAKIDLSPVVGCLDECAVRASNGRRQVRKMRQVGGRPSLAATAMLLDLSRFPDFAAYEKDVRRLSRGAVARRARNAARDGYWVERTNPALHAPDLADVQRSKWFRSAGFVVWTLLPVPQVVPKLGTDYSVYPPRCRWHWRQTWGVFREKAGHQQGPFTTGQQLVGILSVARAGNYMRTLEIIGHGKYLRTGMMDLLYYDFVRWVFDERDDGETAGVQYLGYGALEHGAAGLAKFKRKYGFEPHLLNIDGCG